MIVVAGGSGVLGRSVVSELTRAGERVRVLARDTAYAESVVGDRVEVVAADVRRPDGLGQLVAGASAVVSAVHGFLGGRGAGPAEVDVRGNAHLTDAARANGAHMVLVSVLPAATDSPVDLFRAKAEAERYLRDSGASWTIVRSGPFLETWLDVLTQTAGKAGRPVVFGNGEQPIGFVSAADVAALVAGAATDAAYRSQILEISGPPLTMNELADALQRARGWTGPPRHIPPQVLRLLATVTRPVAPAFARKNRTALQMDTEPGRAPGP
jgi:uncharacterized protein YbjT (DUF2867 family)